MPCKSVLFLAIVFILNSLMAGFVVHETPAYKREASKLVTTRSGPNRPVADIPRYEIGDINYSHFHVHISAYMVWILLTTSSEVRSYLMIPRLFGPLFVARRRLRNMNLPLLDLSTSP